MQQMLSNGAVINEVGHVMAAWPRIQFGAANSDTPYALATLEFECLQCAVSGLKLAQFESLHCPHLRKLQDA